MSAADRAAPTLVMDEPHQQWPSRLLAALRGHAASRSSRGDLVVTGGLPWPLRIVLVALALACLVALLTGCSASMETDNTPWGKARVATEAKPPPPIYSRSSRSTVTKPPPPAPEVEETTCENGVCGVPVR